MHQARRLAGLHDLLALGEHVRADVIEGMLELAPPVHGDHIAVQLDLGGAIRGPFDRGRGGPGGWIILGEVAIRFTPHTIVVPDLVGWHKDRIVDPSAALFDVVPDWVCEIVSASREASDRVVKRRIYAEHKVPYYWIADPGSRTLEALKLDSEIGRWIELGVYGDEERVRIEPFDAIELDLSLVFPERRIP